MKMNSKSIHSLSEFLLHAGTDYRIFDLGRGIYPVDSQTFLDIENGVICPPKPRQQHAWYAVVFWQTSLPGPQYIWFVKFPLDEQGKLVQAARNHFLQIIVDTLGHQIATNSSADKLPDNPYTFVPSQQLMAQFSAHSRLALNHSPVAGIEQVKHYLGASAVIDWQQLSIQAIVDTAVTISQDVANTFIAHFDQYSAPFIDTFLSALESVPLPRSLEDFFIESIGQWANDNEKVPQRLSMLRALSSPAYSERLNRCIQGLLSSDAPADMDLLSVIAARHDAQLDILTAQMFMQCAARADLEGNHQHQLFIGLFTDLVQIPSLRRGMLTLAKAHQHTPLMQEALAALHEQLQ